MPALITFQYDAKVPASWQWQAGVQRALPWSTAIDVSYVGNHGFNRLGGLQGGTTLNLNAVDIGAAYLPQNQDPTLRAACPARTRIDNLLRPYRGLGNIEQNTTEFHDTYHSIQTIADPAFPERILFRRQLHLGDFLHGQYRPGERLQHTPDGTFSIRADQAEYEELNKKLDMRPALPQGQCHLGTAERARRAWQHRRASSTTGRSRACSPPVPARPTTWLQLPEQRREREPDRLA